MEEKERKAISDVINICDKYGRYDIGDLLLEMLQEYAEKEN